jgi:hypothetical protein
MHQLMPNAIVQINKFIWAVTSCGGHPTADVFALHMSYIIRTKRFIWKVLRLLALYSLGINLFIRHGVGIVRGLPP